MQKGGMKAARYLHLSSSDALAWTVAALVETCDGLESHASATERGCQAGKLHGCTNGPRQTGLI